MRLAFPDARSTSDDKGGVQARADLCAMERLGAGTHGRWEIVAHQLNKERLDAIGHVRDMVHAIARATVLPRIVRDRDDDPSYLSNLTPNALKTSPSQ